MSVRHRSAHAAFWHVRRPAALLCALLALALLGSSFCAFAAAAPTKVRAGYFYNGDFMHKAADGSYEGYDIEYYYTLAGYANWDLSFVEYDSLNDALAGLQSGEIDIMSGLSKTPERESSYLVSSQKMCTAHIAVQVRAEDDRFAAGDTDTMTGMTCGILRGSNVVKLYRDWCTQHGLTPHVVEYDSLDARNQALAAGEVDAIAGGSTISGAQKIAEFPSLDLYFMLNRGRADLRAQLDRAMSILLLENPTHDSALFARYFPATRSQQPSFSAAEKSFLSANQTLRAAVLRDDAPFSYTDADGSVRGILPTYLSHLGTLIGARIVCVPVDDKQAACAALEDGSADLIGAFGSDVYEAQRSGVLLSSAYLRMNLVQITRTGTGAAAKAAVPECNQGVVTALLQKQNSSCTVLAMENSQACFEALRSGRADAVICTQPAATWLLDGIRSSDYMVLSFGRDTWDAVCALPRGDDGNTLRSILDKTFAVDGSTADQIVTSELLADTDGLSHLFDRLPVAVVTMLALAAVLALILVSAALVILLRRRRTERALEQKQAELEVAAQANRARRDFFGAVSHDMRTPLNGILGFADLALDSEDPQQVRDYLCKIRRSGQVLGSLVNDMLVISRIENGKYVLHPAPVDTGALLESVLEPVRAAAQSKGVVLVENTAALGTRMVCADRLSLQKILLNLLSNAIKFTPAGGTVTFDCRREKRADGGIDSILTVADTGVGIAPEFLPHIFEPFAQEHGTNADVAGSGLGLSIVKSIVDAMGGSITAVSGRDRGAVFTVRLCLPDAGPGAREKAPAPGAAELQKLAGRRVLVCEDNALNLEIVRALLEKQGMEVVGAENGKLGVEAFAASAPGSFDAVLLDLRMPVLDGLGAARAIRALDRGDAGTVPIFAVSADAYPENVADCLDAGMDTHIAKPIDADQLLAALLRYERHRTGAKT